MTKILTNLLNNITVSIGVFKELILKTVVFILAKISGLKCSKDKLWDTNKLIQYTINAKVISAYEGLKVAVIKDNRYVYLSFSPSFHFDESVVLSSEERKQFTDLFHKKVNGQKPNFYVEKYIKDRLAYINSGKKLKVYQPISSNEKIFALL